MKTIKLFIILILTGLMLTSCVTAFGKNGVIVYFPGFPVERVNWEKMEGIWFQNKGPTIKYELYKADMDSKGPYHIFRTMVWKKEKGEYIGYLSKDNPRTGKVTWIYTDIPTVGKWHSFTWKYTEKIYWNESGYWRE